MRYLHRIGLATGLVLSLSIPCTAQTWTLVGSLKTGRHWHRTEVLPDGRILIIGGITGSTRYVDGTGLDGMTTSSCEIFDPITNRTAIAAGMNMPHSEFPSVVTPGGKVLVFGGLMGEARFGHCTDIIEEYEPLKGGWTVVGRMTTERRRHAAVMIDDRRVLVVGGARENLSTYPTTEIYDIVDHTTTQVGDLPQSLKEGNLAMVGGVPTYVGGREGGGNSPRQRFLYMFDVATNTWVSGDKALGMPAITSAASSTPEEMIVCGGSEQEIPYVLSRGIYVVGDGAVKRIATMDVGRTLHAMVAVDETTVLVSGGVDARLGALSSTLLADVSRERILPSPPHRIPRAYHSLVRIEHPQYGTTVYAITGMQEDQTLTPTIERLSMVTSVDVHDDADVTLVVSPNPVVDVATVSTAAGARLDVIDITGRTVFSTTASSNHEAIDMHACPPGVYAVRMTSGGIAKSITVVKR